MSTINVRVAFQLKNILSKTFANTSSNFVKKTFLACKSSLRVWMDALLLQKKTRSIAIAVFKTPCLFCYQSRFCCNSRCTRLFLGLWCSGPGGMDAIASPERATSKSITSPYKSFTAWRWLHRIRLQLSIRLMAKGSLHTSSIGGIRVNFLCFYRLPDYLKLFFGSRIVGDGVLTACGKTAVGHKPERKAVTGFCVKPPLFHRCRSRQFLGGAKDFCPNFPKLTRKLFVRLLPTNFLPQRAWKPFVDVWWMYDYFVVAT